MIAQNCDGGFYMSQILSKAEEQEIVKRYSGSMEIKREDKEFELFLFLPVENIK